MNNTTVNSEDKMVYTVQDNNTETLFILWVNGILSTAIYIQKTERTQFISMVDSTGYNRGHSIDFIIHVLRSFNGFIVCFSYPKEEFIFGKSSLNPQKRILEYRELFELWKFCVEQRCDKETGVVDEQNCYCPRKVTKLNEIECMSHEKILNSEHSTTYSNDHKDIPNTNDHNLKSNKHSSLVLNKKEFKKNRNQNVNNLLKGENVLFSNCFCSTWSNFLETRSFPYENFEQIDFFSDDPMTKLKMKGNFKNLKDLFEGLLVRKDFLKGGLLFSNCNCRVMETCSQYNFDCSIGKCVNLCREEDTNFEPGDLESEPQVPNLDEKFCIGDCCLSDNCANCSSIQKIILFLRASDFSTQQACEKASRELLSKVTVRPFKGNGMGEIFKDKRTKVDKVKELVPRNKRAR